MVRRDLLATAWLGRVILWIILPLTGLEFLLTLVEKDHPLPFLISVITVLLTFVASIVALILAVCVHERARKTTLE